VIPAVVEAEFLEESFGGCLPARVWNKTNAVYHWFGE